MSEQLPYNDEQWNDLPLPDGDAAWEKMQLLLDEDEKPGVIPFWWTRYAVWGVLLSAILVSGWMIFHQAKTTTAIHHTKESVQKGLEKKQHTVVSRNIKKDRIGTNQVVTPVPDQNVTVNRPTEKGITKNYGKPIIRVSDKERISSGNKQVVSKNKRHTATPSYKTKLPITKTNSNETKTNRQAITTFTKPTHLSANTDSATKIDVQISALKQVANDSLVTRDTSAKLSSPPIDTTNGKKKNLKKKSTLVWSAGIGMQQAIALNGQQTTSYNYYGKPGSLTDHIPSVYLQLQRERWYLQTEFQYSVPLPVNNVAFSQVTRYDTILNTVNTERYFINKVYYHQLPVSLNYLITSHLSVGVGSLFNLLAGAVTERQLISKNIASGNEQISKTLAPVQGYKDSFLYKTTAAILLQTEYHQNRFSVGLRYAKNWQPYIAYTKPNGEVLRQKTEALQAIIRFRLWKK